ncbi:hypothetical protein [Fictibacillus sp. S7]|nr:hypothetical protein [Fictibacillus sp. S7]
MKDFLGGTFHQDNSPEQALDEFIRELRKECMLFTIRSYDDFLKSKMSKQ